MADLGPVRGVIALVSCPDKHGSVDIYSSSGSIDSHLCQVLASSTRPIKAVLTWFVLGVLTTVRRELPR